MDKSAVSREEFESLRSLVLSIVKRENIRESCSSTDRDGLRYTNSIQTTDINVNKSDISDNRTGIEEAYEASLTNADDIADVRTALEEVYEMITEE